MIRRAFLSALVAGAAAFIVGCDTLSTVPFVGDNDARPLPAQQSIGLYELRIYTAAPGKLAELDARFRDHTIDLFRKHGMTPVAFFHVQPAAGQPPDDRLFYLMGYKDRATRDQAWTAFAADPQWQSVYKASQANGSLTSAIAQTFLANTDYSPQISYAPRVRTPRLFELRTYHAMPGRLEDLHARFRNHTLAIFKKHGMTSMGYWHPAESQKGMEDKMTYLLAYPSLAARDKSWAAFSADPEWTKVSADSQKTGPMLVSPGGVVSVYLMPTDYSPLR